MSEWFDSQSARVPQLQSEAMTRAAQNGRLLTFGSAERRSPGSGELQTPRVFSRRDDEATLIVAKP